MLESNARQILDVVTATFPSFEDDGPFQNCDSFSSDIDGLACRWRAINRMLKREDRNTDEWAQAMNKVPVMPISTRMQLNKGSG
jgi:ethanolaminephosphotransferase